MPSRRTIIVSGIALAAAAAGIGVLSLRPRAPRARPPGVPLGPFGRKSTAAEVVAGLDLSGRTFMVTGATSGLGLESARVIAARGAHVIVTGRMRAKAAEAVAALPGRFTPVALELTDFDSVVRCAEEVRAAGMPLDGLICNAGVMELPGRELVYGLEKQFVTNHLGHFVLVNRLRDRVIAAPQGRVVVVASNQYRNAPEAGIEFDNLDAHRDYAPTRAYGHSKLANGLFVRALAKRLAATSATANVIVPGVALTNLGRHQPLKVALGRVIGWTFMKSTEAAAATQVYVATAPALAKVSGQFFADCNPEVPGGHMQDDAMAERLWQVSEQITAKWLAG
jgi:NAD(P)-dependent dehydrogenase (short-subunit alcohol dehydrogenase family)